MMNISSIRIKKIRKISFMLAVLIFSTPLTVYGSIPLTAPSAILIDQNSGKVLYAHNEHERMYPAGLAKMMTALVVLDHLNPDDVIVVGTEIYQVPPGAIRAGHQSGEHITVRNLLRGLMIRNGNDSGNVLAQHTVQTIRGQTGIPFVHVENIFSGLMIEKARELGANNTSFTNPNGLHHDSLYTTAYDMALIARAFMQVPLLRNIVAELEYVGDGMEGREVYGARILNYNWVNDNELMISGSTYYYTYATGIRRGSTPQASDCLAASAERNGVRLIAIIFDSPDPGRWLDARMLFDYGFDTYSYHTLLESGQHIQTAFVYNARRGEDNILDVRVNEDFAALLSQRELSRIRQEIVFYERFLAPVDLNEEGYYESYFENHFEYADIASTVLIAPIEENEVLGTITFTLDGNALFIAELHATREVPERTIDSDMDYIIAWVQNNVFSLSAWPYWIALAGTLFGFLGMSLWINERRRGKKSSSYSGTYR